MEMWFQAAGHPGELHRLLQDLVLEADLSEGSGSGVWGEHPRQRPKVAPWGWLSFFLPGAEKAEGGRGG